jgi:amino acid adenylation domain-containing protein
MRQQQSISISQDSSPQESSGRLGELQRTTPASTNEGWYPLSHGQEALWFLWKLAPHCWAYNMVFPIGVRGELDVAALHRSLQKLTERHPLMRTEFKEESGKLFQRTIEQHRVQLEQVEAADWNASQVEEAIKERAYKPFNLEANALPRFTLLRRGPAHHVFIIVVHHITSDLSSLTVLMDELREVYAAEKAGAAWSLPPLPVSYEDYVRQERSLLQGETGERLCNHWQKELAGSLSVLDLPTDRLRPAMRSFRGGMISHRIDAALTRQLRQLARNEEASFFTTLLTAYVVLLHRYSNQDDIIVGTPTGGRKSAELGGLFGDLVNMAPLRIDLTGKPSFRQLLAQARARVRGIIEHQDFPFSLIVDRLQPVRDLSRSPIFQTTFVLQKFHSFKEVSRIVLPGPDEPTIQFADLILEPIPLAQQDGQFDINLEMKEDDSGRLMGAWKYSADLFEADTITRMAAYFETLLREIVANPDRPVGELRLLTSEESLRVVTGGQGAQKEFPAKTVCELFEAQVEQRGAAIAVRCGEASLTYSELGQRVRGLARSLMELGVGPDVLVAVLLPRGLDFVTMLLAIHKAGGAFLPLDLRHPPSRIVQILESSGVPLLLTSRALDHDVSVAIAGLDEARRPRVLNIEEMDLKRAGENWPEVDGNGLAYVMYTSGSTGSPKGVMVEHCGMVNHVLAKLSDLEMNEHDILAQNGPQSFDIVVWQCLAPLVLGGQVLVLTDEAAEDPARLVAEVERRGVSVLQLVPSMLHAVLEELTAREEGPPALSSLRWIVPTGEALPTELCRRWLELYPNIPLLNTYGSTECSDDQCHYRLDQLTPMDDALAIASIGKPVQNLSAYVLDRNLLPVPFGVVGELYIGGVGVGRGYRHDPARTAAAFIPDPFSWRPGARLYRTRDWARQRADGNLDFLGRVDHMIKLRGFRIEPEEIEAALCRHPSISKAAVVAQEHPSGERRLVGYIVHSAQALDGGSPPSVEELRQFLADSLPQYMIPATLCSLDALPLSANGKLDQRRLPAVEWKTAATELFVAPRTRTEEKMAGIWSEALGLERVGVMDDFFSIGGDSILSIQILARCKRTGLHLSPSDVFMHRTIAALSALADDNAQTTSEEHSVAVSTLPGLHVHQEHLELAFGQVEFDEQ